MASVQRGTVCCSYMQFDHLYDNEKVAVYPYSFSYDLQHAGSQIYKLMGK